MKRFVILAAIILLVVVGLSLYDFWDSFYAVLKGDERMPKSVAVLGMVLCVVVILWAILFTSPPKKRGE